MCNVLQFEYVVHICDPWKFLLSGNQRKERWGLQRHSLYCFKLYDANLTESTIYDNKSKEVNKPTLYLV